MSKRKSTARRARKRIPEMTMRFRGLCTFIRRDDSYQVYLLTQKMIETARGKSGTGHGHDGGEEHVSEHRPVLAVRIKDIFIDGSTTWLPDVLAHDFNGMQIGIWHLEGKHLTFTTAKVAASKRPQWTDTERNRGIDLEKRHRGDGLTPKTHQVLLDEGASSVTLRGGSISSRPDSQFMELKKGGTPENDSPRKYATAITWNIGRLGSLVIADGDKHQLKVRKGASIAITNVAPVPESEAFGHFAHYYCIYENGCPVDNQLSIHHAEENVFDCVPPTPGPKP